MQGGKRRPAGGFSWQTSEEVDFGFLIVWGDIGHMETALGNGTQRRGLGCWPAKGTAGSPDESRALARAGSSRAGHAGVSCG